MYKKTARDHKQKKNDVGHNQVGNNNLTIMKTILALLVNFKISFYYCQHEIVVANLIFISRNLKLNELKNFLENISKIKQKREIVKITNCFQQNIMAAIQLIKISFLNVGWSAAMSNTAVQP